MKTAIPAFLFTILLSCAGADKKTTSEAGKATVPATASTTTNLTAADTTGQLMPEDEFWKIIEASHAASNNKYRVQIDWLSNKMASTEPAEIVKFNNTFNALLAASYNYRLWGASYVINGGCSDDCFEYFREYIIAHGKEKFYATYLDPESCISWIKSEDQEEWEGIRYAASNAYKLKTGKDIPETAAPGFDKIQGKPFDEATVEQQYPLLAKKFSGRHQSSQ